MPAFRTLFSIRKGGSYPYIFIQSRVRRLVMMTASQATSWLKKFFFFSLDRLGFMTPSEWNLDVQCILAPSDRARRAAKYKSQRLFGLLHVFLLLSWRGISLIVSKHDSMRLSSLLPDELERQICANFSRNVQLASELRVKYEQMAVKVATLEREADVQRGPIKTTEERALTAERKQSDLTCELHITKKDLEMEVKGGRHFLDSPAKKERDHEVCQAAAEEFCRSSEFESELSTRVDKAALVMIATTIQRCRAELRAYKEYNADDFNWW